MNKQKLKNIKKSMMDDYRASIDRFEAIIRDNGLVIQDLQEEIEYSREKIKSMEDSIRAFDSKAAVILEEIRWLRDNGYARLDGRVAKAVYHRGFASTIDLMKRRTSLDVTPSFIAYKEQYWCSAWFPTVVSSIPTEKRPRFYETIVELKDDPDELEKQIGIWLLNAH